MELHPLCTLFPRMNEADFDALVKDIDAHGLRQPIITHNGMILDGGNRYRACKEVGITPIFKEYEDDDIQSFVLSANMHRRHLTAGQYAAIVASVANWAGAAQQGGTGTNQYIKKVQTATNSTLQTTADRAAQSGVSKATQRKADAVAKADPVLAKAVGHGEISLNEATKIVAPQLLPTSKADEFFYSKEDEQADKIIELEQTIERLQISIAENLYTGEEPTLIDIVEQLRVANINLAAENQSLKSQLDVYLNENAELKRTVKRLTKK